MKKKTIDSQVKPVVRWWKWVCEFCFKKSNHKILPKGWDLVWQSAVCPDCIKRVERDGGYFIVKGGAYAKCPDPRSIVQRSGSLAGCGGSMKKKAIHGQVQPVVMLQCSKNKCPRTRKVPYDETMPRGTVKIVSDCPWHSNPGDKDSGELYFDVLGNELST